MKRLLFVSVVVFASMGSFAQPPGDGPRKPPPLAMRWKHDSSRIMRAVGLTTGQLPKVKAVYMNFYKEMDALVEKNKGTRPPREAVESTRKKRDDAVGRLLTKAQQEKLKGMKPEMMPRLERRGE